MFNENSASGDVIIEEKNLDSDEIVVTKMENEGAKRSRGLDDITSSVKDVAQKTGEAINRATDSIGKAIEAALSARDHVVMVRVNDEALKRLDALVQSGIFKSRSEAAAFLIGEGIKSQEAMFERISSKIEEIERLRSELRTIIQPGE